MSSQVDFTFAYTEEKPWNICNRLNFWPPPPAPSLSSTPHEACFVKQVKMTGLPLSELRNAWVLFQVETCTEQAEKWFRYPVPDIIVHKTKTRT